jgi:hypothetical protein
MPLYFRDRDASLEPLFVNFSQVLMVLGAIEITGLEEILASATKPFSICSGQPLLGATQKDSQ